MQEFASNSIQYAILIFPLRTEMYKFNLHIRRNHFELKLRLAIVTCMSKIINCLIECSLVQKRLVSNSLPMKLYLNPLRTRSFTEFRMNVYSHVVLFLENKPSNDVINSALEFYDRITEINCSLNSPVRIELKESKPLYSSIVNISICHHTFVVRSEARRNETRQRTMCNILGMYFFCACSVHSFFNVHFWAISNSMLF